MNVAIGLMLITALLTACAPAPAAPEAPAGPRPSHQPPAVLVTHEAGCLGLRLDG